MSRLTSFVSQIKIKTARFVIPFLELQSHALASRPVLKSHLAKTVFKILAGYLVSWEDRRLLLLKTLNSQSPIRRGCNALRRTVARFTYAFESRSNRRFEDRDIRLKSINVDLARIKQEGPIGIHSHSRSVIRALSER